MHLEFMFAGTGAKDHNVDFNNERETKLPGRTENLLVSMIADADRIRRGDLIIFYLQQDRKVKIPEGKFYGIFRALQNWSFLDYRDSHQYLKNELGKSLTFRTLIEPSEVYSKGITEWEALDEIEHIRKPEQMLWSLIYRKLRANRGNTMITPYESSKLCELIRRKNEGCLVRGKSGLLTFNVEKQAIVHAKSNKRTYRGRRISINILPRLVERCRQNKQFEPHLQAFIARNLGTGQNQSLDCVLLDGGHLEWFGNEVSCGVGMQRIDLLLSVAHGNKQTLCTVELKSQRAKGQTINQMQRYVDWVRQYYIPNCRGTLEIQPVLIARKTGKKTTGKNTLAKHYGYFIESLKRFSERNKKICHKVRYVEFDVLDDCVVFERTEF